MTVTISIRGFEQANKLEQVLKDYQHQLTQESVRFDSLYRAKVVELEQTIRDDAARAAAVTSATLEDAQRRRTEYPALVIPPELIHVEVSE